MVTNENVKWVIIEVLAVPGQEPAVFIAPYTLKLEPGFVGQIVWYVFTSGWELSREAGVAFLPGSGFDGRPQPDPDRPACWSTAAANEAPGTFHYTIAVARTGVAGAIPVPKDPVVENEAPPTLHAASRLSAVHQAGRRRAAR